MRSSVIHEAKNLSQLYDEFWAKVNKTSTCWHWLGSKLKTNYGRMSIHGKMMASHRLSWIMFNGPIPNGLCVLHKCDVPDCLNPEHLFLGTMKDNVQDMLKKNRASFRRATTCNRGHDLEVDNAFYCYGNNKRCCRLCRTITLKRRIRTKRLAE